MPHFLQAQERETPRDYIERESHYLWGRRYLMAIVEQDSPPRAEVDHRKMTLHVRPGTPQPKREAILAQWYRDQLRAAVPPLVARWEPMLGVELRQFYIQHMKTRWGSSSPVRRIIRLNTELVKKPPQCLEYIIVHEMLHFQEPTRHGRGRWQPRPRRGLRRRRRWREIWALLFWV